MSGIQKENSVFFFIPEREYLGLQIKGSANRVKYKINLGFPFLLCSSKKSTEHTEDTEDTEKILVKDYSKDFDTQAKTG